MKFTPQSVASDLKSQIVKQLPQRPLVGGGFHRFVLKASTSVELSQEVAFEAFDIMLEELAADCPEWSIELEGTLDNLKATFTR